MTHVGIHWTTRPAKSWENVNASDWEFLPKLAEPVGGELIDTGEGWVYGMNIQGVVMRADHYAIEFDPITRRITAYHWNDDPDDYAPGEVWGKVWEFDVFDGSFGNTRQGCAIFGGADYLARLPEAGVQTTGGPCEIRPFNEFVKPREALIRHGSWADNALVKELDAFPKDNRDAWLEGVFMRFSAQTVTFLLNAPDTSNSDCDPGADFFRKLDESGQTSQDLAASVAAEANESVFAFTSLSGVPGVSDWPVASVGDPWFCNMNIVEAGGDLFFGVNADGFARVNSSCTLQDSALDDQTPFSGTGVHAASNNSWNPASGSVDDRFQIHITSNNTHMHAAETLTIRTDSSSDAGGPWAAAAPEPFPPVPTLSSVRNLPHYRM